jgi:hypothetical protein
LQCLLRVGMFFPEFFEPFTGDYTHREIIQRSRVGNKLKLLLLSEIRMQTSHITSRFCRNQLASINDDDPAGGSSLEEIILILWLSWPGSICRHWAKTRLNWPRIWPMPEPELLQVCMSFQAATVYGRTSCSSRPANWSAVTSSS